MAGHDDAQRHVRPYVTSPGTSSRSESSASPNVVLQVPGAARLLRGGRLGDNTEDNRGNAERRGHNSHHGDDLPSRRGNTDSIGRGEGCLTHWLQRLWPSPRRIAGRCCRRNSSARTFLRQRQFDRGAAVCRGVEQPQRGLGASWTNCAPRPALRARRMSFPVLLPGRWRGAMRVPAAGIGPGAGRSGHAGSGARRTPQRRCLPTSSPSRTA
jgi:hypothetical protein